MSVDILLKEEQRTTSVEHLSTILRKSYHALTFSIQHSGSSIPFDLTESDLEKMAAFYRPCLYLFIALVYPFEPRENDLVGRMDRLQDRLVRDFALHLNPKRSRLRHIRNAHLRDELRILDAEFKAAKEIAHKRREVKVAFSSFDRHSMLEVGGGTTQESLFKPIGYYIPQFGVYEQSWNGNRVTRRDAAPVEKDGEKLD
ncbi:hypothetical protein HDU98_006206 [Podochytrium sp. JEL0797]|nr:hypothetical protein HDU98_006206 [Podochytrium sp. JEL0797]